jgi:hypothetical protein
MSTQTIAAPAVRAVEVDADLVAEVVRLRAAEKALVAEKKAAEDRLRAVLSRAGAVAASVGGEVVAELGQRARRNADLALLAVAFPEAYAASVTETAYAVLTVKA